MLKTGRSCAPYALLLLLLALAGCGGGPGPVVATAPPEPALRIAGSGASLAALRQAAAAYQRAYPAARFAFDEGSNTDGAVRGIVGQTLDLATISRPVAEVKGAAALEFRPFARDPVAFAVHAPSPVRDLTTAQIRDIYGGGATTWRPWGGTDEPLIVLDRPDGQSGRSLVLLPLLGPQQVGARTVVLSTSEEMVTALNNTPNAVGYTPLGELGPQAPRVQVVTLDGVAPDAAAVRSGAYPWSLTYRLLVRPDAPPPVRRFMDWVLGPDGQRALQDAGYANAAR